MFLINTKQLATVILSRPSDIRSEGVPKDRDDVTDNDAVTEPLTDHSPVRE
jgi:hypothetical protein